VSALNRQVLEWTASHHNVATTADLLRLGVSRSQIRQLVEDDILERVLDGAYRFVGAPYDELARCVAACAHPAKLVVEGPAAGRLWRVRRMPYDGLVYVIAPPASHPTVEPWLRVYRTAALDPQHIVERPDGIRLTSPPRTALDLTRYLPDKDLRSVIDHVESSGMGTAETMRRLAYDVLSPGRPWVKRFIRVLDQRPQVGVAESHWESRVVAALMQRGITDLRLQRWLDVPDWGRIRLDASVDRLCWGVEIDVYPTHFEEEGGSNDRERDLACDAIGWRVNRVGRASLKQHFDLTIDRLMRVYERRCREFDSRRDER